MDQWMRLAARRCLLGVSSMTNPSKPQKFGPVIGFSIINVFQVISAPVQRRHVFYSSNGASRQDSQQASKIIGGSEHLRVKNYEMPSRREIPAKIGTPDKNDNNIKTVRDKAKLYIRHQYETDIRLSIGDVTIYQRPKLLLVYWITIITQKWWYSDELCHWNTIDEGLLIGWCHSSLLSSWKWKFSSLTFTSITYLFKCLKCYKTSKY